MYFSVFVPLSPVTVNRVGERATQVFPRIPGAAVGSPSPLRPLRRRRGEGIPGLSVPGVYRVEG